MCEDIAKKLETVGYMKELTRTQVGEFKIEDSITIQVLDSNKDDLQFVNDKVISIERMFENSQSLKLEDKKLQMFLNGVKITQKFDEGFYRVYDMNNVFIGIGIIQDSLLKRDIVI